MDCDAWLEAAFFTSTVVAYTSIVDTARRHAFSKGMSIIGGMYIRGGIVFMYVKPY